MVAPILLTMSIAAFLFAAFLSERAYTALLPYLPQHFSDKDQALAFAEYIFEPRTPLSIQFKAVCSSILGCIATAGFSCTGIMEWQNSNAHNRAGYFLFGLMSTFLLWTSISSIRKYRCNVLLKKRPDGVDA
jgi:hypothetical protein